MILTDTDILLGYHDRDIHIAPFKASRIGPNSYDVRLSPYLALYDYGEDRALDPKKEYELKHHRLPPEGAVIVPNTLYLGSTIEEIGSDVYVPMLEGKSSVGRLGIQVHLTAGVGDIGFKQHWTLEITCVEPVILYPGMPIAQVIFHKATSKPLLPYDKRVGSSYRDYSAIPQASRLFQKLGKEWV